MENILCQVKSDKIKLSKTLFFILHLTIPILGLTVFLGYLLINSYNSFRITIVYFQVIALCYPLITALLTSLVVEQEIDAGSGFFMLVAPRRSTVLFSKLLFLLVSGLFSCLLFALGYSLLAPVIRADYTIPTSVIFARMLIIFSCSIFSYLFHLWIGLKFGKNTNFAVAVFEILLSALLLTGLGETIWFLFPCAWGARLASLPLENSGTQNIVLAQIEKIMPFYIIIVTVILLLTVFVWFKRWEGRKSEE